MAVPEQVLEDLQDQDEEVRRAALTRLAQEPDVRALPDLRAIAANDESVELRFLGKRAILVLAGISPDGAAPQTKAPKLDDPDPGRRVAAIHARAARGKDEDLASLEERAAVEQDPALRPIIALAIGAAGTRAQIPALDRLLEDPDLEVRRAALEGLTLVRDTAAYPYFVRFARDTDDRMRAIAMRQLGLLGREKVLKLCEVMARAPRPWMASAGLGLLMGRKDPAHVPLFQAALRHADGDVRAVAREALSRLAADGVAAARDALDSSGVQRISDLTALARKVDLPETGPEELRSADAGTRLKYVQSVMTRRDTEAVPSLIARLERETDNRVLAMLVTVLGQMGDQSAVEGLREFLTSKNDRVRANAVEALGRLLPPEQRGMLVKSLDDANNRARTNAVLALWGHGHAGVREALSALKTSTDKKARLSAIYAIGQIGEAASGLLNDLLEDADREVQQRARECWRMLGLQDPSGSALPPAAREAVKLSGSRPAPFKGAKPDQMKARAKDLEDQREQALRDFADAYQERIGQDVVAPPEIVPLVADVTAARAKFKHNKPETKPPLVAKQVALARAVIAGNHWDAPEAQELIKKIEDLDALVAEAGEQMKTARAGGSKKVMFAAVIAIVIALVGISYYLMMAE